MSVLVTAAAVAAVIRRAESSVTTIDDDDERHAPFTSSERADDDNQDAIECKMADDRVYSGASFKAVVATITTTIVTRRGSEAIEQSTCSLLLQR